MRKGLRRMPLLLFLLAIGIQIVRPAKTNPNTQQRYEISAVLPVHREVDDILGRSCNDCHSNRTVWPWYSNIAPVSWLVVHDVNDGRGELNFSEWGLYDSTRREKLLAEICKEVQEDEMPTTPYTTLHAQAKLSAGDVQTLCSWTEAARKVVVSRSREIR